MNIHQYTNFVRYLYPPTHQEIIHKQINTITNNILFIDNISYIIRKIFLCYSISFMSGMLNKFQEANHPEDRNTNVGGNTFGILVRHRCNVNNDGTSVNSGKLDVTWSERISRQILRIYFADGGFSSRLIRSPVHRSVNLFLSAYFALLFIRQFAFHLIRGRVKL